MNLSVACVIETISAYVNTKNIPLLCISDTLGECILSTKQLEFLDIVRNFVIQNRDQPLHKWLHEYSFTTITLTEIQQLLNVDVELRDAVLSACDHQVNILNPLITQLRSFMRNNEEASDWYKFLESYTSV